MQKPVDNIPEYTSIESLNIQELSDIGILEITIDNKVHYGIGIFVGPKYLVTLARYIVQHAKFAVYLPKQNLNTSRIFLKNNKTLWGLFQKFNILQTQLKNDMLIGYTQFEGIDKVFVRLTINKERMIIPNLMERNKLNELKSQKYSVKSIGLPKDLQNFSLLAKKAQLTHISDINLPEQSAALIYLLIDGEQYLYGIFDNVNNFGSEDYFLSNEPKQIKQFYNQMYKIIGSKPELYIIGQQQNQTYDAITKFPYNSIGILLCGSRTGTAQALIDKVTGQCKYLLTCAHNFVGSRYNLLNKTKDYSFRFLTKQIPEQPGRFYASKSCPQFKIKKVHIRNEYMNTFSSMNIIPVKDITVSFNSNPTQALYGKNTLNDIALIQLQYSLKFYTDEQKTDSFKDGFRLNLFEKPFSHIIKQRVEITGYPATGAFDKIYKKQYTSSCSKKIQEDSIQIEISENKNKVKEQGGSFQILRHYLSTLAGNSGSAIYQKDQKQVYLFGVHIEGAPLKDKDDQIVKRLVKFAKINPNNPLKFGKIQFEQGHYNIGTYLYSPIIYQWWLKLPFMHNVTNHYKQLISSIAVIEYQQNGKASFGLGLMTQDSIVSPTQSKQISYLYVKQYSQMSNQENILLFDLQQKVYEPIDILPLSMSFNSSGFTRILVSSRKDKGKQFKMKKFDGEDLSEYKGLAISIAKRQADQNKSNLAGQQYLLPKQNQERVLQLNIKVFDAKDMQKPLNLKINTSAFLFAYNYENQCLIWSYYDKQSKEIKPNQYFPKMTDKQYFLRDLTLKIITDLTVLKYRSNQDDFRLGLIDNEKSIIVPASKTAIDSVYTRRSTNGISLDGILKFKLNQAHNVIKGSTLRRRKSNIQNMEDLEVNDKLPISGQKFVHISTFKQENPENSQKLGKLQIKGLAISIQKAVQNQEVTLKIEAFDAKDILEPKDITIPALLFVYDYQSKRVIWSHKHNYHNEEVNENEETVPQSAQNQYFSRVVSLVNKRKKALFTANILWNNLKNSCKYLITAASSFVNPNFYTYRGSPDNDRDQLLYEFQDGTRGILQIKKIWIHQSYRGLNNSITEIEDKGTKKYFTLKDNSFFDIAIIQLEAPLDVKSGFRIKNREAVDINTLKFQGKTVGFNPKMHKLILTDNDEVELISVQEDRQIIKHYIQTMPGFGGCAISHKGYLYGIHTTKMNNSQERPLKFATSIYQPGVYEWIESILGGENIIEENNKEGGAQVTQCEVFPYGVFQIKKQGEVVGYGLGVVHASKKLVTFKKYFKEGRALGRIFFKKLTQGQKFPLSYAVDQANLPCLIETKGHINSDELKSEIFVKIELRIKIKEVPIFLPENQINSIDLGKRGYAIGLDNQDGDISLHKITYELDSHIMDLRLKYETALLFVFKGNEYYCYGFYQEEGDKNLGYDLYLSDEFLAGNVPQNKISKDENPYSRNQSYMINNNVQKVQDQLTKVPFQSIGILRTPQKRGYGTAQLLKNEKGCKYLITCAHNFIGYSNGQIYNRVDRREQYTFQLPTFLDHKPLRYAMREVSNFKIKEVYIPKEYSDYFMADLKKDVKDVTFLGIGNDKHPSRLSINKFYDIAIIQLKDNLEQTHGFTIEKEKPADLMPVQVAGFPTSKKAGKVFGIVKDRMYVESTASHPNDPSYVRFSQQSEGDIIMLHKLSTLPGNSGSAIYKRISDKKVHLLAIHTTGVGPNVDFDTNPDPTKEQLYGSYNLGTYIYSPNIKKWINTVFKQ